jgi:hypothetical protein
LRRFRNVRQLLPPGGAGKRPHRRKLSFWPQYMLSQKCHKVPYLKPLLDIYGARDAAGRLKPTKLLPAKANQLTLALAEDQFELCLASCRASSATVQIGDVGTGSHHHCFGYTKARSRRRL